MEDVADLGGHTLVVLGLVDELVVQHLLQDPVHAVLGQVGIGHRVIGPRRVGQARQQRGLGDGHVLRRVAEVVLCAGLHPVGGGAEGGDVEIAFEDLVLGVREGLLQGQGVLDLPELARRRRLRGRADLRGVATADARLHQDVAHVLLGEGGRSLAVGARRVGGERAQHAGGVDALVLVEALVLDGDDGVLHVLADIGQRHHDPVLGVELGDLRAVGGAQDRDLARLEHLEVIGEVLEELQRRLRDHARGPHEGHGEPGGEDAANGGHDDEGEERRHELARVEGARRSLRHAPRLRVQRARCRGGWHGSHLAVRVLGNRPSGGAPPSGRLQAAIGHCPAGSAGCRGWERICWNGPACFTVGVCDGSDNDAGPDRWRWDEDDRPDLGGARGLRGCGA